MYGWRMMCVLFGRKVANNGVQLAGKSLGQGVCSLGKCAGVLEVRKRIGEAAAKPQLFFIKEELAFGFFDAVAHSLAGDAHLHGDFGERQIIIII